MSTIGRITVSSNLKNRNSLANTNTGQAEIKELTSKGVLPAQNDLDKAGDNASDELLDQASHPYLMGQVAAVCNKKTTAKEVVDEMVKQAVQRINLTSSMLQAKSKL
jgi:hypothetical protein